MLFLERAVHSLKWAITAMNGLKPVTYSYLNLIDILYEALARDKHRRKAREREAAGTPTRDGFRQSRWKHRKNK